MKRWRLSPGEQFKFFGVRSDRVLILLITSVRKIKTEHPFADLAINSSDSRAIFLLIGRIWGDSNRAVHSGTREARHIPRRDDVFSVSRDRPHGSRL
jgi:hypothetical protein